MTIFRPREFGKVEPFMDFSSWIATREVNYIVQNDISKEELIVSRNIEILGIQGEFMHRTLPSLLQFCQSI